MKTHFSQKQIDDMCVAYASGRSLKSLMKDYHCGTIKPIKRTLLESGVKLRTNDECIRKYTANYHYFDCIDTPNKAYILGFLYADGCNYMNDSLRVYHWYLQLKSDDIDILDDIRKEIGYTGNISVKQRMKDNTVREYADITVCNHHMCQALTEAGVMPNKTLETKYPVFLDDRLARHFIRGLMDGDGCIHKRGDISISGTEQLIASVREKIENLCGIKTSLYIHQNNGKTNDCNIGKKYAKTFLDWIYNDSDLKMRRKYERYVSIYHQTYA